MAADHPADRPRGEQPDSSDRGHDAFWDRYVNLAQPRLGAEVVWASDEFFASKDRLIDPLPPRFDVGRYDDHGKWMDGWETRRRRDGGHDACIVKLGFRSLVHGVDIDTSHFNGNQPVSASLFGRAAEGRGPEAGEWIPLVENAALGPDRHHLIPLSVPTAVDELRLDIFPDGGVARLRVFGVAVRGDVVVDDREIVDLAAVESGGWILGCNDQHFGRPQNLLLPGRGVNMGDGWETRRRRTPGHDWAIVVLGCPGRVERLEVDTAHFKGNYPDRISVQALPVEALAELDQSHGVDLGEVSSGWPELLGQQRVGPDAESAFEEELEELGAVAAVRLNLFPDGGVSRLRVCGRATPRHLAAAARLRHLFAAGEVGSDR